MAPKFAKSSKSKKKSLALVVSILEMAKGQKRKAQTNMSKGQSKKKKGELSSTTAQERNTLYFKVDTSQERYNLDFSLRKILNGRWVDYGFFDSHHFELSMKMDNLGIIKSKKHVLMVSTRDSSKLKLKGKKVMKKNKAKHNKGEAKPRGVQIRDVPKGKCFHCGKDGHWKRNCPVFIAIKKKGNASKLETRSEVCLFVGYPKGIKGDLFYNPNEQKEEQDPNTYKEAEADIDVSRWQTTMKAKIESMYSNQVWELVDPPINVKPISWALSAIKVWLSHNFDMKDLGEVSYILGIKLMRDRKNRMLGLSQAAYIDKMLVKTGDYVLIYESEDLTPIGYSDSDFQLDRDSRKSTSYYMFTMGGRAISWRSVKQSFIVDSTIEAEYIAACEAAKEAVWLKKFLLELGVVPLAKGPIIIYCDNSATIAQFKNPRDHKKGKHIERKYHLIREIAQRGDSAVTKIASAENLADPFTKTLTIKIFESHVQVFGLRCNRSWL
ncbi:uncharacterized protein LOC130755883 [Actinidia eriantha]|uniref:uncharacterized protein LOC130755883 n=1 Tax=Actinidia eriantha TaxID=165200 RepID=UPI0025837164|nr:uncharacterized protein LOC130755883 [Actinidia eriantha]